MSFATMTDDAALAIPLTPAPATVAVVEDDPTLGALALDLCRAMGYVATLYDAPADFLAAAADKPPSALVLDWRLQGQLGAAAFMAVRHRYPAMPVVCWTASAAWNLPQMIRQDPMTRVIDKAAGATAFEAALRWAMAGGTDDRHLPHPA
ncbi:MAG TPA: response regulator [Candidatus Limnocylindria bacterium]|nr:response regulator [Candidatus Limnocylindria bacterium]